MGKNEEQARKWIRDHSANLPSRVLPEACLPMGQVTSPEMAKNWVLGLYKKWVLELATRRNLRLPLNLVIHHSEEEGGPMQSDIKPSRGAWLQVMGLASQSGLLDENSLQLHLSRPRTPGSGSWFLIDSHRTIPNPQRDPLPPCWISALRFWHSRGGRNRAAKDAIENPPDGFSGLFFLLQLFEMCVSRYLVIDERVADHLFEVGDDGCVRVKSDEITAVCAAGVHVVPCFHVQGKSLPLRREWAKFSDSSIGLHFQDAQIHKLYSCQFCGNKVPPLEVAEVDLTKDEPPFDVAVIHRTQLAALAKELKQQSANYNDRDCIEALRRVARKVVVTSGKGTLLPGDDVRDYPFVEFSVLESYLIREIWKHAISSVLISAF